jgi:hypothetical protein
MEDLIQTWQTTYNCMNIQCSSKVIIMVKFVNRDIIKIQPTIFFTIFYLIGAKSLLYASSVIEGFSLVILIHPRKG